MRTTGERPWHALGLMAKTFLVPAAMAGLVSCYSVEGDYAPNQPTGYNVVFVTFDGMRWQEFFNGADPLLTESPRPLFTRFWKNIASRGKVFGNPSQKSEMRVSNAGNASLPAYTSIFAEVDQGCLTNFCSRIAVPTMLDRMSDELGIEKSKLAVIATWRKIDLAVTGRDDVAYVRTGARPSEEYQTSPYYSLIDGAGLEFDNGTVPHAFEYLEQHRPRFLYLSLLDSDRYGHQGNYPKYLQAIEAYDRILAALVEKLDSMDEYGRKTALVVTTDHGRGSWGQWSEHGPQIPASSRVWSFVMLPPDATELTLADPTSRTFNHHDVRFTIEALMGLGTRICTDCGTGFIKTSEASE